ncbi:MAG: hypothetical protein LBU81_07765 [Methanosarcinales archaeon]|jgi:hypothetical protein|nr:hypothetical protein [Methanosarcinales archaeon]
MSDSIGTILSKGWDDFKSNPIMAAPTFLMSLIILIIIFAAGFIFMARFAAFTTGSIPGLPSFGSAEIGLILLAGFAAILFSLISVFIEAGLTGMAKEAVTTGKTSLNDLWTYGKKYFFRYLCVSIIIGIICMIPLTIICLPFVLVIAGLVMSESMGGAFLALFLLLVFYIVLILAALLISLPFFFASAALIIDDCGISESIRKSWNLFMENKKEVFWFAAAMIFISIAVTMIFSFFGSLLAIIPLIGLILNSLISVAGTSVLGALVLLWTVRKYYNLTAEDVFEESAVEFSEYSEIEQGILDAGENTVSEEVYEETAAGRND